MGLHNCVLIESNAMRGILNPEFNELPVSQLVGFQPPQQRQQPLPPINVARNRSSLDLPAGVANRGDRISLGGVNNNANNTSVQQLQLQQYQ
jgi:hypothetical protein